MTNDKRPNGRMLDVYTIIEKEGFDKSFWVKVGGAFRLPDGSIQVFLDALPTNGKLRICESKPKQRR